jgi:hypothetical protein
LFLLFSCLHLGHLPCQRSDHLSVAGGKFTVNFFRKYRMLQAVVGTKNK